ncbi:MAG: hypothetical protein E7480_00135 [Ruminococcaceae bacterium]|nr:hypothetical protein [Oscillospiraceae bacterium]
MFKNIGSKIMTLAKVICVAGIVLSVLIGLIYILVAFISEEVSPLLAVYGILLSVFGSLLSWLNSFFLYGFGRLIENSDIIAGRKSLKQPQKPIQPQMQKPSQAQTQEPTQIQK